MSKRILIEEDGGQREIALMEEKRLLFFSREMGAGIEAEQIYLGQADRFVKGLEAVFVKLSRDAVGFLPFSECLKKPVSGEKMLVQVKKAPVGEKAAYLTEDISLAGRFAVLTPLAPHFAVSKRVEEEEQRARLLSLARELAPEGMGLILRKESEGEGKETIRADVETLASRWRSILSRLPSASAPCLLEGRQDALSRLLRDEHGSIGQLLTNAPDTLPEGMPAEVVPCERPFELYNVRDRLKKSFQRKIWLDCGGYLILDRTEAMTVIDVNSGKFTGGKAGAEDAFLKLNLEAAREIARLLRLRNIGGIIIIDFVDMLSEESRAQVAEALRDALKDDPVKTVLHGFTALGLMEMTRKKTGDEAPLSLPICPRCHGAGIIQEE